MKRITTLLLATVAALVLPGCIQSETTVHLNTDGSGTVVEQTTLGAQMLAMLDQMAALGGGTAKDPVADMFSAEKAKARAATMGEGVTFVSSEPLKGEGKGAVVTYKFADINKLKLSTTDSLKDTMPARPGRSAPEATQQYPMTFTYSGGTLVMTLPDRPEKPAAEKSANPEMDNPQAAEMMKQVMGDLKISYKVVVEGGIAHTDATYHDGNNITLVEVDMAKIIDKPETLKKLTSIDKNDPGAAIESFKGIDGVKMESKKQVTVKVN